MVDRPILCQVLLLLLAVLFLQLLWVLLLRLSLLFVQRRLFLVGIPLGSCNAFAASHSTAAAVPPLLLLC
jgi:hypothetical protein